MFPAGTVGAAAAAEAGVAIAVEEVVAFGLGPQEGTPPQGDVDARRALLLKPDSISLTLVSVGHEDS